MTNEIRLAKGTGILLIMIGLFVFLLYLYFFVPFNDFLTTIQQANLFCYSLAFIALLLSAAFYSLTWHNLLKLLSVKASFLRTFQFIWIGSFVDLLIPIESVSGDISKIYLMSRESGENAGKVVASVVGHRILSGVVTIGGLVISSVYFLFKYRPSLLVLEFIGIVTLSGIVSMSLMFYLSTHPQATDRLVNWVVKIVSRLSKGRWRIDRLKSSAEKLLTAFHEGITTLSQRPKGLVLPAILTIVAWFFDLLIMVLVFFSLGSYGVKISFSGIVIVYSIVMGIQSIPVGVPGDVGLVEIVMTTLYTILSGDPSSIALFAVATTLIRVLTLWMRLFIGGVAVQWVGIKGLKSTAASN